MQQLAAQAVQLHQSGKLAQAEKLYRQFIAADPNHAVALHLLGLCLFQRGRVRESLPFFERSVAINARDPGVHINHALALTALGDDPGAMRSSERAVAADANYPGAHNSLGAALYKAQSFEAALSCFERAVRLKPDYAEALANLGLCRIELGDLDAAIESLTAARSLNPDAVPTISGLGNALALKKDYAGAIAQFERLVTLDPQNGYARAHLHHLKRQICDWRNSAAEIRALAGKDAQWRKDRDLPPPFIFLSAIDHPRIQFEAARLYAGKFATADRPLAPGDPPPARLDANRKIRVGYLSPDFRQHPIGILIADLLDAHDRERFEIYAFSYGSDGGGDLRRKIEQAVDVFVDVEALSADQAAARITELEIDIMVDLAGYTTHSRPGILARRPAPVQAHYLGYLGSMGADWIDYVIADDIVAPAANDAVFSETIVRLPGSLQVNPKRSAAIEAKSRRSTYGLPDDAVVFCCFNNTYKLSPEMFDVWMRILSRTPGSVLWLFVDTEAAKHNLRHEAAKRNVEPERLVFADRVPYEEHLARHHHADLFLDTLPYNAGTTASDALWSGLPVLTCAGRSFASRMAASLVSAAGIPEMIVEDLASYEARAIRLAQDATERKRLRDKLAAARASCSLFDLDASRRKIEAAYVEMMRRWRAGEQHKAFRVPA